LGWAEARKSVQFVCGGRATTRGTLGRLGIAISIPENGLSVAICFPDRIVFRLRFSRAAEVRSIPCHHPQAHGENAMSSSCEGVQPVLLDVNQVAKILGVSRDHVRTLARQRRIPHVRIGKLLRFKISDIGDVVAGKMQILPPPRTEKVTQSRSAE